MRQPTRPTTPPGAEVPPRGATVALRADGAQHEVIARVTAAEKGYVFVEPAPRHRADTFVDLCWPSGGHYRRGRARVIGADGEGVWLAVGDSHELGRRLFVRTAPPRPLEAVIKVLDRSGRVAATMRCPVSDLSLGGVGLFIDRGLEEGAAVEISLLERGGKAVLTGARGEIVRVTIDSRGQIAGARFDNVMDSVHALSDLLGT